jgi:riboflavin kinase / FMN adenylyltransferase
MDVVRIDPQRPVRWPNPVVAVGNLDGVHRGHQALVAATVGEARRRAGTAVVLTFDPHPARVLAPERAPSALTTLDQKAEVLATLGLDRLAVLPFTADVARLLADQFVRDVLGTGLGARVVVVGASFRFGQGRTGDTALLELLGRRLGFDVLTLEPVLLDGAPVSSTRVREALDAGAVEEAARLLGRLHFVDGTVVKGDGRGRTLGFPTANLEPLNETLPGNGVYACWARLPGEPAPRKAAVNVGRRPTFDGEGVTVEAHLIDYAGDLYGRALRLEFEKRLRPERKFEDLEALKAQIEADLAQARGLLRAP